MSDRVPDSMLGFTGQVDCQNICQIECWQIARMPNRMSE